MIRIAIAGVGNCASSLVQGLTYYSDASHPSTGLMEPLVGSWGPGDIEVVAAFDVDARKVGRALGEAVFALPNCAVEFCAELPAGPKVQMGPVLDGVAPHLRSYPKEKRILLHDGEPVNVVEALRESGAEVLVCYLPVGAEQAVRHYAQACLEAGVAFLNCVPVFIASDPEWARRFAEVGLPLVGDDIKSQFGATILHRTVARLLSERGVELTQTYQLNTGGNTDFLNMLAQDRLTSKKQSKTESVQSQLAVPLEHERIHIGPSDYVPWQGDNKVAFLRLEGAGFGGLPMNLEMRLSVQDSPNSAGVVVDAIRCLKLALERGMSGPLVGPSAYYMKSPPRQMSDPEARQLTLEFITPG